MANENETGTVVSITAVSPFESQFDRTCRSGLHV